jgi:NADH dehydrogenase
VILGQVTGVDKDKKCVFLSDADRENVPIPYDYLVLATGVTQSYFGHNEFAQYASALKTLVDAVAVRNKILQAFEQAEAEEDPSHRQVLLTFILVGAGPTGVEMAAALAVLVRSTLQSEFRRIDPAPARIVLVDMAPRVLPTFSEDLSTAAKERLQKLGVEVRLRHSVDLIDADGIIVAGERIVSKTAIWTAGAHHLPQVSGSTWLPIEHDEYACSLTSPCQDTPKSWSLATLHLSIRTANRSRELPKWHSKKAGMGAS